MADGTKIEWARHPVTGKGATWNPITGCALVSEGCRHCYAARLTATRMKHHPSRKGLARFNAAGEAKFTGEVRFNEQWLDQPLRWRTPRGIFVCAHGDLFAENVPDEWIDKVFAVMALAPQHIFMVLTKRPERAQEYLTSAERRKASAAIAHVYAATGRFSIRQDVSLLWPLHNVWLGTSVEDQATADARIPHLLATPAAIRFVSAEPLLGPVDMAWAMRAHPLELASGFQKRGHFSPGLETLRPLDWVIAGGESGPHARPIHPDWVRSLRDQCFSNGVPFLFKQWGEWTETPDDIWPEYMDGTSNCYLRADGAAFADQGGSLPELPEHAIVTYMTRAGKSRAGRSLDGQLHNAMPEVG